MPPHATGSGKKLRFLLLLLPAATILSFALHASLGARWGLSAVSGALHAGIYAALLCFFAGSLRRGRDPVVSAIARILRGQLPPELETYTRRVTWMWVWFCAGQLLASLLLLIFAPLYVWALFVSVLNLPLIAAVTLAEYAYRRLRWRRYQHEPVTSYIRVWHHFRSLILS